VFLTAHEFRDVRNKPGHFVARPDHVDLTHDEIVVVTDRYVVVTPLDSTLRADAAAMRGSGHAHPRASPHADAPSGTDGQVRARDRGRDAARND
jgi:hypothetical protein